MQIILNGAPKELAEQSSIISLVNELQLAGKRLAVEVNREIIPKSQHGEYILQQGDQVEIVHAIGGG